MPKSYNYYLVALSLLVAVFVSNSALALFCRLTRQSSPPQQRLWILGGGLVMGCGIWATHFVGMLALSMPIRLMYDLTITVVSFVLAIVASVLALIVAARPRASLLRLLASGGLLGGGIAAMHYCGMSAIQISPSISNDLLLLLISVGVGVAGSFGALWILFRARAVLGKPLAKIASACVLGLSIGGMHYTGMWASRFDPNAFCTGADGTDNGWLAIVVATVAFALTAIMTVLLAYDAHLNTRMHQYHNSLEHVNNQLQHAATHDALTGLPNRAFLARRLDELVARPPDQQRRFAVLLIDLDRFKEINDSLGHQAGDQLLCTLSERLAGRVRGSDSIARLGGDEFVVVADSLQHDGEASMLAERLQTIISKPVPLCGLQVHISASIGMALGPVPGINGATLLQRADAAMYHIKNNGRCGSQLFSSEVQMPSRERLETDDALRTALSANELELHYQPKVDVRTGHIEGAEALIRWRHPQKGLVAPGSFIPLAEETGLIVAVGEWVLREACRQMRAWEATAVGRLRVAVNVSAQQFQRVDFSDVVSRIVREYGVDPALLELELTETAVMRDAELSIRALRRLTELGVSISLDDFGTGYSSLSYLRRLPLNKLKIDRSFMQELGVGGGTAQIVRSIVALAHNLNLKVVAEGVETVEQLRFLREVGCDKFQGFYFSPPLPAAEFASRVMKERAAYLPDAVRAYVPRLA
jgi:diguanylate cyclase